MERTARVSDQDIHFHPVQDRKSLSVEEFSSLVQKSAQARPESMISFPKFLRTLAKVARESWQEKR